MHIYIYIFLFEQYRKYPSVLLLRVKSVFCAVPVFCHQGDCWLIFIWIIFNFAHKGDHEPMIYNLFNVTRGYKHIIIHTKNQDNQEKSNWNNLALKVFINQLCGRCT
jgi:hypothetical protein